PHARHAVAVRNILFAESACYHEKRLQEQAGLMGPAARERLEVAKFTTATDYIKAQRMRTLLMREVDDVFKRCDVFVVPTVENIAALLNEGLTASNRSTRPLNAGGTFIASVTGIPSLAVPCGFSAAQPPLPFSMLIHARSFQEITALRVAYSY